MNSLCMHGTLIVINQQGILITGNPGIGKSNLALNLLNRGHQIVSDDAVDINIIKSQLIGSAPPKIEGKIWVYPLGLFDIIDTFSSSALLKHHTIDVILQLKTDINEDDQTLLPAPTQQSSILNKTIDCIPLLITAQANLALHAEIIVQRYFSKKHPPQLKEQYHDKKKHLHQK